MKEFTDDTPMPFGKHRGIKMCDVDANYLLWIYDKLSQPHPPGDINLRLKQFNLVV